MAMNVAVVGATGYTGGELLRLLTQHPEVKVTCVTSEQSAHRPLVERLPFLRGHYALTLEPFDPDTVAEKAQFIFLALSHTQAMSPVRRLIDAGKKVIDLSADFRLQSPRVYQKWYKTAHSQTALLKKAVYGLTEVYREQISRGSLVANPGCYPTGALLPLYPFLRAGVVDPTREIIIDAKSGVSGAGRSPTAATHFTEVHEGFSAYQVGTHRHLPEISQEVARMEGGGAKTRRQAARTQAVRRQFDRVLFTPYLLPVNRGILTTIYLPLKQAFSQTGLDALLADYQAEPFIRRLRDPPNLAHVRGSNFCDLAAFPAAAGRYAILMSAIDNLGKGAAGQAIQNMNVMMGWSESLALSAPGFSP